MSAFPRTLHNSILLPMITYPPTSRRALGVLLLVVCAAFPGLAQQLQDPVYRSETHLIDFTFSVRGTDDKLVTGLKRDDFQIVEDGETQKIAFFGGEDDLPLSLGLIVDMSGSQSKFIKLHAKDVEKFLKTVVGSRDEVFTICFGNHLRLTNESSSSVQEVLDGLKRFDKGDRDFPELSEDSTREGGTALYDAIFHSVEQKLAPVHGRRKALVLFTDGEENASAHDLLDALQSAQGSDTLIFAIRYTDQKDSKSAQARQGATILRHLAVETGGSDYDALHENVEDAFAQIAGELRSLYSVAYHSTHHERDGAFHKVVISTNNPAQKVHARAGYYAR